ncbi:helix-turn-helix transcriptional regulator [Stenotrophomonas rhizophila]|uniref:helix-turn-helix transcriptional regulator n=1 Tax=Stenotrophomonas rhizophila TaxID=216778 RepID=UPI003512C79D
MDGSFPLQRDPDLASPVTDANKWRQEIAEAKQGLRAKISTKAAAHYVGVHHTTLREWVREGQGPQPMQNPAKAGTMARNQHLGFSLDALDAFLASRSGEPITRGKRTDAGDVVRKAERIEALIALKEAEDRLAKALGPGAAVGRGGLRLAGRRAGDPALGHPGWAHRRPRMGGERHHVQRRR